MNLQNTPYPRRATHRFAVYILTMNLCAIASAQVPRLFNYQAQLAGYGDTSVHLKVRFWTLETGGLPLFYEDHGLVTLDGGLFSLMLGSISPNGVPDLAVNSAEVWLELEVDGTALPRTRLVTIPYAIKSLYAEALTIPGSFTPSVTVDAGGNIGVNAKIEIGKAADKGFVNLLQADGDHGIELDGETSGGGGLINLRGQTDPSVSIWGADPTGGGGSLFEMKYGGGARVRIDANESSITNAGAAMSMYNSAGLDTVYLDADSSDAALLVLKQSDGSAGVQLYGEAASGSGQMSVLDSVGNQTVIIEGDAAGGTYQAQLTLQQSDGSDAVQLKTSGAGGSMELFDENEESVVEVSASGVGLVSVQEPGSSNGAFIYGSGTVWLKDASAVTSIALTASDGRVKAKVVEITGADLAEKFPTSEAVAPGMVVAIDPQNPGRLCLARGAYNRCVAGVVSGANNLPAGAILGNLPGHESAPPIALSGRVWVHCDAQQHGIEPGDRLTTSDTAGHAMKASDMDRAAGAVIGKAMTGLAKGESGLVLLLVDLQ